MVCPYVVVIEDDDAIRESLCEVLKMEGYRVLAFANGKLALEGLQSHKEACLILLDLMMPVMNGWEFLEARKEYGDTFVAIPVFIVSAIAESARAQGLAAEGYIKKPIDLDVLLDIVRKYCIPEAEAV